MVTEIMGFLIIVGALLVVIVRRQMQKRLENPEQINTSVADLQSELENAGNSIIERIGTQVDRLEDLVAQADERIAVLDEKLRACESVKINAVQAVISETAETGTFKGEFAETLAAAERASEPQPIKECHAVGKKILSNSSIQVASLLEAGYSIEEVSRKTGMGKGAIELICEMNRVQKNV